MMANEAQQRVQVPKVGAILPGGQLMHISLDTCDREAAETKATEITLSLNAASEAKPGVAGQPLPKKSRAGSRLATSSPISLEFPPSTSLLDIRRPLAVAKQSHL